MQVTQTETYWKLQIFLHFFICRKMRRVSSLFITKNSVSCEFEKLMIHKICLTNNCNEPPNSN